MYAQSGRNVLAGWQMPLPLSLIRTVYLKLESNGISLIRGCNNLHKMDDGYTGHPGRPKRKIIKNEAACLFHVVMTPMSNEHLIWQCKVMHKYGGRTYYTKYVEHLRKCHGINCFVTSSLGLFCFMYL